MNRPYPVTLITGWFVLQGLLLMTAALVAGQFKTVTDITIARALEADRTVITASDLLAADVTSLREAIQFFAPDITLPDEESSWNRGRDASIDPHLRHSPIPEANVQVHDKDKSPWANWDMIPLADVKEIIITPARPATGHDEGQALVVDVLEDGSVRRTETVVTHVPLVDIITSNARDVAGNEAGYGQLMGIAAVWIFMMAVASCIVAILVYSLQRCAWYMLMILLGLHVAWVLITALSGKLTLIGVLIGLITLLALMAVYAHKDAYST